MSDRSQRRLNESRFASFDTGHEYFQSILMHIERKELRPRIFLVSIISSTLTYPRVFSAPGWRTLIFFTNHVVPVVEIHVKQFSGKKWSLHSLRSVDWIVFYPLSHTRHLTKQFFFSYSKLMPVYFYLFIYFFISLFLYLSIYLFFTYLSSFDYFLFNFIQNHYTYFFMFRDILGCFRMFHFPAFVDCPSQRSVRHQT